MAADFPGFEAIERIANFLHQKTKHRPKIGIICGSGLSGLVADVQEAEVFPYADIPGFPVSTVQGHAGQLVFGTLQGQAVVCMKGRFHFYEGHSMNKVILPVRVMVRLGIKCLFVTNAAGGINPDFVVGDVMIIKDHIGIPLIGGQNPLIGLNDERFGPRFPPMTVPYNRQLRKLTREVGEELGFSSFLKEGVYVMLSGPNYETPAEIRFLKTIGADAVGMSTVPEVVAAVHCGLKVIGLSLITNVAIHDYEEHTPPHHQEVLDVSAKRAEDIQKLVGNVIKRMDLQ